MKVVKRNGKICPMLFDKVTARISKLTYGLSGNVSGDKVAQKVFSSMYDGMNTHEIDSLSSEICIGMITDHPDYEILATRITASNIRKIAPKKFSKSMKILFDDGILAISSWLFISKNSEELDKVIDPSLDFIFGFFGLKTLEKNYLQKVNNTI